MKKNHTNLFTPSLFTLSIYEIIYAALFIDYRITFGIWMGGIGGRNFMLVRGENLPMKYPWGEPRGTS